MCVIGFGSRRSTDVRPGFVGREDIERSWHTATRSPTLTCSDASTTVSPLWSRCPARVKSHYLFVTETSRHLVDAGGKRFRPMLVLMAAEFGDAQAAQVLQSAVVVELTHLATCTTTM